MCMCACACAVGSKHTHAHTHRHRSVCVKVAVFTFFSLVACSSCAVLQDTSAAAAAAYVTDRRMAPFGQMTLGTADTTVQCDRECVHYRHQKKGVVSSDLSCQSVTGKKVHPLLFFAFAFA